MKGDFLQAGEISFMLIYQTLTLLVISIMNILFLIPPMIYILKKEFMTT
jgi:hypothetical protein